MNIIHDIQNLEQTPKNCVLTIGNFDGVHIGHRQIIDVAKQQAQKRNTCIVSMTFEPHPVAILHPEKAPGVLTPLKLKQHLLTQIGIDYLIVLESRPELLSLSPKAFVDKILAKKIKPALIVEGEDFNFGARREGNIETLRQIGSRKGFEVLGVPPKKATLSTGQTVKVSSTIIRYMLESGHVADATATLSRPYRIMQKITPGRGIGKKLGFPTLNMEPPQQILPAEGVYAGFVEIEDSCEQLLTTARKWPAAFSIGQARTFGPEFPVLIEAHLLTTETTDAKDKWMTMDFVRKIRNQHKFSNSEQLSKQIEKDCRQAKQILTAALAEEKKNTNRFINNARKRKIPL